MKAPKQCSNIEDIRSELDLNRQIIKLLGKRFGYVKAASKFKTTKKKAPQRFEAMLQERRIWALQRLNQT